MKISFYMKLRQKAGHDTEELSFILSRVPRLLLNGLKVTNLCVCVRNINYFLQFAHWSSFQLLGSAECGWMFVTPFTLGISMWSVS